MRNMWPLLLDSSEEECMKTLRRLELEAYGCLVSALRAQGGLTSEKLKILKDTASALHITPERHRAEIRRAVNDEQLCTIAQFAEGPDTYAEWSVEGRRKVRLVPRVVPQTAFLAVARRVADVAQADNAKMPWPAATARPPPISKIQTQSAQIKHDHEDRIPKKRRRLSDDNLPSLSQSSFQQSSQSIVYTTQSPGQQKHRIQKHGISKIQQMYKNQSRLAASTFQRQQPSSSVVVSHQEIMPPPRTTIKTIPPVKQNKTSEIAEKNLQVTTSVSAVALSTPISAKVIHQNKSLIKISTQNPSTHQKLVIVSASQQVNSNIIHQTSSAGSSGTNKIITTPINTIKIKTTVGGTVATIGGGSGDDLELKCSKLTNQQVIVSKSQLTPLQTIHHGHHSNHIYTSGGNGDTKSKVLTVQAKVRPQGSIIVPLQGQTATSSGQFAGVSVPVLQGVQWKAIQGKSTVKLLPLSGNAKIIQKQGGTVGSAPIYVMSKSSNLLVNKTNDTEQTKTTLNNITHIRPLTQKSDDTTSMGASGGSGKLLVVRKATPIITTTGLSPTGSSPSINIVSSTEQHRSEEDIKEPNSTSDQQRKSTVLQEALRASGVTSVDDDIESQISQYTVIPKTKAWASDATTITDHHSHNLASQSTASTQSLSLISTQPSPPAVNASKSIQNIQLQDTKFLTLEEAVAILGDNSETRAILSHLQVDSSNQRLSTTDHGQLDPQTGIYSPTPANNASTLPICLSSNLTSISSANVIPKQTNEQRLDIFNTALVSADVQLDSAGGDSVGDGIMTSNNIEEQNSSTDEFYTEDNVIIDNTQLCPTDLMQTEDVVVTTSDETITPLTDKQLTEILTGSDDTSDDINDVDDNSNR